MSTTPGQADPTPDDERDPSAMDGADGDDRSSENATPTPVTEAEPQPN